MIRVNLARNRAEESPQSTGQQAGPGTENTREAIIKIAFISLFTVGLMIYESQNLHALQEELARMRGQLTQKQAEETAKKNEVDKVKDVEVRAKELEDKLKLLKFLSKLRLREVKTLDFLQSTIPEKVWLRAITFESPKEHMETGHFQVTGNSVTSDDLGEFVKKLEDSSYLVDVIVVKNVEIAANKSATIRDFLFTAEVGNKN